MNEEPVFFGVHDRDTAYKVCLPDATQDYVQKLIAEKGEPYEVEMLRDMAAWLSPGDLVLDVGANIGNHTLYLAMAAQARVIAYEPNEHLTSALASSIEHNSLLDKVQIRTVGVGRAASMASFAEFIETNLGAQKLAMGDGAIQVVSLDEEVFPSSVRMIKIDVEGMELDVLEGAANLITRDRPLIYAESQDEVQFRELSRWMRHNGYTYWETFNITPTHLFRPAEQTTAAEQIERLMAREVAQEYRLNVQLRRARRFQRAADDRSTQLTQQLEQRRREFDRQAREVVKIRGELVTLKDELALRDTRIRHLGNQLYGSSERVRELEQSTAYQLGLAIAVGATSLRGAARLPITIGRLLKRGLSRRLQGGREIVAPTEPPGFPDDPLPWLRKWLKTEPRAAQAVSVLYADINLNIVDGSSVWLSSMASILCSRGVCVVVAKIPVKSTIITSNIRDAENLVILSPDHFDGLRQFRIEDAVRLIRALDGLVTGLRRVVVRGLDIAFELLRDRQFESRMAAYLTDFYSVSDDGVRQFSEQQLQKTRTCLAQADAVLVQTPHIERALRDLRPEFRAVNLPPPIPTDVPPVQLRNAPDDGVIRIGYAGKINSRWGVIELLDWAEKAKRRGYRIELHIIANRISNGPDPGHEKLREHVLGKIQELGARYYADFNRQASMGLLSTMDFVWCWRPPRLEEHTLELSTKLVEMVALGARCICYPSEINIGSLGDDYPYFARGIASFIELIGAEDWGEVPKGVAQNIAQRHSIDRIRERVGADLLPSVATSVPKRTILFAGHDMKFLDAYASALKASGISTLRDNWEWGRCRDEEVSRELSDSADIVFCEWGLANAVWYSKTLPSSKRLIVRIHAQEVRERARRFGAEIDHERVDCFVFVSEEIRDRAIELWEWPEEKTVIVPNYVLEHEFTPERRTRNEDLTLGMVGIVPTLKRFDRALDLLCALADRGVGARLKIKGHRPEMLEFMHAPGRRAELDTYFALYTRIEQDKRLQGKVHFEPWGNDVADWYKDIDVILSCSDTESFHYALADGVLSGCHPVVWPWPGAERIYRPDWVVADHEAAAERVLIYMSMSDEAREQCARANRAVIVSRYGSRRVFSKLDELLLGQKLVPNDANG